MSIESPTENARTLAAEAPRESRNEDAAELGDVKGRDRG